MLKIRTESREENIKLELYANRCERIYINGGHDKREYDDKYTASLCGTRRTLLAVHIVSISA